MRTVMLVFREPISRHTMFLHVCYYKNVNELWFYNFGTEKPCRESKDCYSVGMWKIKKLK